jgi:hypothetical protein
MRGERRKAELLTEHEKPRPNEKTLKLIDAILEKVRPQNGGQWRTSEQTIVCYGIMSGLRAPCRERNYITPREYQLVLLTKLTGVGQMFYELDKAELGSRDPAGDSLHL